MSKELNEKFTFLEIKKSELEGKKCRVKNWNPNDGTLLKGELIIVCEQLCSGKKGYRVTNELISKCSLGSVPIEAGRIEFI